MGTKVNKIDFTGKTLFVGLDVHYTSWFVTVIGEEFQDKQRRFEPSPEKLGKHLNNKYQGAKFKIAYEAGSLGFWIKEGLDEFENIDTIVVNAADVPTTHKEKTNKTDKADSLKLAQALKGGFLKGIYVPNKKSQEYLRLNRRRHTLVKEITRTKQRIKAELKFMGIDPPAELQDAQKYWSRNYIQWLKEIEYKTPEGNYAFASLIRELEFYRSEKLEITRKLRELSRKEEFEEEVKIITSQPGFGLIGAMTILTEIIDFTRFSNADQLVSFVGLCPTEHSSGESRHQGKINKRHNKRLRIIFIEASWTAIRYDDELLQYYLNSLKTRDKNKAITKVAKKLVKKIRRMVLSKKDYQSMKAA